MHPREMAQHDRGTAHLAVHVEDKAIRMLEGLAGGVACDQSAGQRPGLKRAAFRMANGSAPRILACRIDLVLGDRLRGAVKWMDRRAFIIPGVGCIFAGEDMLHRAEGVGRPVIGARLHDHRRGPPVDGRLVVLVLMRQVAPGHELAVAFTIVLQADFLRHAPKKAEVGIGMLRAFLKPGLELLQRLDFLVPLHRAAEPQGFDPVLPEMLQDRPGARHIGQGGRAHHAARHHEGRMRPLPAKKSVDLHRTARDRHASLIGCAGERRVALDRFSVEG